MSASKKVRNAMAGVIVALAAVALGLMVWTGERAIAVQVPITLALAADDTVWVASHGALHEIGADGVRLNRLPVDALGLPQPVLHLHAVRRDDLLVSAGDPMRVHRCTPSQRACRRADAGYIERFGQFKNAVWLGANADGSRVVVSDNAAHRVAVLDADGALLAAAGGSIGRFHYPGQPVWVGAGTIWLASADHHRIERFEFDGTAIGEPVQAIALTKGEPALAGRTWPMALAPLGDGTWWALVKVNMMTDGGLARFDEQGRFTLSAPLPTGADLTAVTRLGDHLIASDLNGPALHRLSLAGADATPFGGDEFQAELRAHGREIAQWYRWQEWAQWALIGAPILGVGLLLSLGEKVAQPRDALRTAVLREAALVPAVEGDAVIEVSARFRKHMRVMLWILVPQFIALPLLWVALLPVKWADGAWLWATALFTGVSWGTAFLVFWATRTVLSLRLIVSGDAVRLERSGRVVTQAQLADCYTDGHRVLIGARVVLARRLLPVMEPSLIRTQVMAKIPPARWLSGHRFAWQVIIETWRQRPAMLWLAALALALVAVLELRRVGGWQSVALMLGA